MKIGATLPASGPSFVHDLGHGLKLGRADVGAVAIAKENKHQLAAKIAVGDALPVCVHERKRAADERPALALDPFGQIQERVHRSEARGEKHKRQKSCIAGFHKFLCSPFCRNAVDFPRALREDVVFRASPVNEALPGPDVKAFEGILLRSPASASFRCVSCSCHTSRRPAACGLEPQSGSDGLPSRARWRPSSRSITGSTFPCRSRSAWPSF